MQKFVLITLFLIVLIPAIALFSFHLGKNIAPLERSSSEPQLTVQDQKKVTGYIDRIIKEKEGYSVVFRAVPFLAEGEGGCYDAYTAEKEGITRIDIPPCGGSGFTFGTESPSVTYKVDPKSQGLHTFYEPPNGEEFVQIVIGWDDLYKTFDAPYEYAEALGKKYNGGVHYRGKGGFNTVEFENGKIVRVEFFYTP